MYKEILNNTDLLFRLNKLKVEYTKITSSVCATDTKKTTTTLKPNLSSYKYRLTTRLYFVLMHPDIRFVDPESVDHQGLET